jgi:hypothetical protein
MLSDITDYNSAMQQKRIEKQIERIQRDLMALGPMRPGALSRQYAACQKPGCACVDPVSPKKHGPFYQLSYSHQGKSTTRFVRPGYVPQIKKELAAYKRFRELTQQWVALALTLSQLRLDQARREEDQNKVRKK